MQETDVRCSRSRKYYDVMREDNNHSLQSDALKDNYGPSPQHKVIMWSLQLLKQLDCQLCHGQFF